MYHLGLIYEPNLEISDVSPQRGSTEGGTYVRIKGKYFYDSSDVPASIQIGGQPCDLLNFDMKNLPDSSFVCQSPKISSTSSNEYFGNRGISFYRDDLYTSFISLATAVPSANAIKDVLNVALYNDTETVDVTIWLRGFISPQRDSLYEFSINTNGDAVLLLSTDSNSANKVRVCFLILI